MLCTGCSVVCIASSSPFLIVNAQACRLQSVILGILAVAFFFVPSEYIDTRLSCYVHQGVASAAADSSAPKKVCDATRHLLWSVCQ